MLNRSRNSPVDLRREVDNLAIANAYHRIRPCAACRSTGSCPADEARLQRAHVILAHARRLAASRRKIRGCAAPRNPGRDWPNRRPTRPLGWTSPKRIVRNGLPVDTLARVYIQRVPNFVATPTALTSQERNMFREFRWWSIDEIAGSRETFIPRTLAVFKQAIVKFFFNARAQTCR